MIFLTRFLLKSPKEEKSEAGKGKIEKQTKKEEKQIKREEKENKKEETKKICGLSVFLSGGVPPLKKLSVLPLRLTLLHIFTRIWRQH